MGDDAIGVEHAWPMRPSLPVRDVVRQRRAEHPDLAIDVGDALGRAGERLEALQLVRQDRDAIELLLQRCQSLVEPGLELVGRRRLVGAPLAPEDREDS